MKYTGAQVTFQEVPNEVSLSFLIQGCTLRCRGCHSADSWGLFSSRASMSSGASQNPDLDQDNHQGIRSGSELTPHHLQELLATYEGFLTCVCFMGGEWHKNELSKLLTICQQRGLKTCLYTGLELDQVAPELIQLLDYIKVGPWVDSRGGLDSPATNQRFLRLASLENLNQLFQKNNITEQTRKSTGGHHDSPNRTADSRQDSIRSRLY